LEIFSSSLIAGSNKLDNLCLTCFFPASPVLGSMEEVYFSGALCYGKVPGLNYKYKTRLKKPAMVKTLAFCPDCQ
jgi:hypothetical protein